MRHVDVKILTAGKQRKDWALITTAWVLCASATASSKLDFNKTNLTEQKGYREFATMTFAAFELSQEITADGQKEELIKKYGEEGYNEMYDAFSDIGKVSPYLYHSLTAQRSIISKGRGTNVSSLYRDVPKIVQAQAFRQYIAQEMPKNYLHFGKSVVM